MAFRTLAMDAAYSIRTNVGTATIVFETFININAGPTISSQTISFGTKTFKTTRIVLAIIRASSISFVMKAFVDIYTCLVSNENVTSGAITVKAPKSVMTNMGTAPKVVCQTLINILTRCVIAFHSETYRTRTVETPVRVDTVVRTRTVSRVTLIYIFTPGWIVLQHLEARFTRAVP
jgi:hypothetical protein